MKTIKAFLCVSIVFTLMSLFSMIVGTFSLGMPWAGLALGALVFVSHILADMIGDYIEDRFGR